MGVAVRSGALGAWVLLAAVWCAPAAGSASTPPESMSADHATGLVLVTLDTTRADALGCYGAATARTPVLDRLAARGARWANALTPSPLTLPAHCSLLTGLEPPEHGVRDNGAAKLPPDLPTLAAVLAARGDATAAFVASRILDRRFELDRGFGLYDDRMAAEQLGEYGYPERDAAAVTDAALAWLSGLEPGRRFFLWVHYYDPHAPYAPPPRFGGSDEASNYAGEVAYVDEQLGRLLAAVGERSLVAVVGDHGESLGEHGERSHGVFLYGASLRVPLLLAGPGVPSGTVVDGLVSTRALPATLLRLLGMEAAAQPFGQPLIGLPAAATAPEIVYSETLMPATAYGWAGLKAATERAWRLILAPRPELYDLAADPRETHNVFAEQPAVVTRLKAALAACEERLATRRPTATPLDGETAAALRSLGYLSGTSETVDPSRAFGADRVDPKDGIHLLERLQEAKRLLAGGQVKSALASLEELVNLNPGNVHFLSHLARAQQANGEVDAALATFRRAIAVNPGLDFLRLNLADALLAAGKSDAPAAYREALDLNPRLARAWLGLAELARRAGQSEEERRLLIEADAAGNDSAAVLTRLGQLELDSRKVDEAERYLRRAVEIAPGWAPAWVVRGELAESQAKPAEALAYYQRGLDLGLGEPRLLLRAGRLALRLGQSLQARHLLTRLLGTAPASDEARQARELLETLDSRR